MKIFSLTFAVLTFLILSAVLPGAARAQNTRSYDLTCSSNDEHWQQCGTPFAEIRDVEMLKQLSDSPCIKGQTWGFDARGVWVDRGCRAEFLVYGRGDRDNRDDRHDRDDRVYPDDRSGNRENYGREDQGPGPRGGQSVVINCKSDDERLHRCRVEGGIWNVRVEEQHSGSPCTQGLSWGFDDDEIWVDRGCRADFRVWSGGDWRGRSAVMRCRSNDERLNRCGVEGRILNVQLERQYSGSPCTRGVTWGFDEDSIWVDRGCRADFRVWAGREVRGRSAVVRCSSDDERLNRCRVEGEIREADIERELRGSPCIQGRTWDFDEHVIWVDRGCRADFRVWLTR